MEHFDGAIDPETVPMKVLPYKTTKLEMTCVGNAKGMYIHAQIGMQWYEPKFEGKSVLMQGHWVPIWYYYRKDRINYCWFDVPEGVLCYYSRSTQTKPRTEERRCFYIHDGQFIDLGTVVGGLTFELVSQFYPQFRGFDVTINS